MKTASADWLLTLQTDPSFLATCYRIERRDGEVFCFTTCVRPLDIADSAFAAFDFGLGSDARTYDSLAVAPSQSQETSGTRPNNLNLQLAVDDDYISERDLDSGLFDYAKVIVFTVDYMDLAKGIFDPWRGYLGAVSQATQIAGVDLNALSTRAEQTIGRATKETCRHKFGSVACGVNLAGNNPDGVPYTTTGVPVTLVGGNDRLIFRCSSLVGRPADFYERGRALWTSGANAGLGSDIAAFDASNGEIRLWDEMADPIAEDDELTVIAGCKKTYRACWEDHDNAVNMGAYPKAPTLESAGMVNNR